MSKPYLFLDVDGPLNPYNVKSQSYKMFEFEKHWMNPDAWLGPEKLLVRLSKEMGAELAGLSEKYELVWATTWEHEANTLIGPELGLPELPVIVWPEQARAWAYLTHHRGSWKTPHLLKWIEDNGPRPWVFVDDDIAKGDRALVREHYEDHELVSCWLVESPPTTGITRKVIADLHTWADELD